MRGGWALLAGRVQLKDRIERLKPSVFNPRSSIVNARLRDKKQWTRALKFYYVYEYV